MGRNSPHYNHCNVTRTTLTPYTCFGLSGGAAIVNTGNDSMLTVDTLLSA